jgi:ParB family chromosome partitioning protein
MRVHNLKILNDFADAVAMGDKTFEIRENDRGYQKGDYIKFLAIEKNGTPNHHCINNKLYLITFVMNGWGIKNGYVVLGIKESEGSHDRE